MRIRMKRVVTAAPLMAAAVASHSVAQDAVPLPDFPPAVKAPAADQVERPVATSFGLVGSDTLERGEDQGPATEPVDLIPPADEGSKTNAAFPTPVSDKVEPVASEATTSDPQLDEHDRELSKLFEGGAELDASGDLPDRLAINVRRTRQVQVVTPDSGGVPTMKSMVYLVRQSVDPKSKDLSPEQRLGVMVAVLEQKIKERHQQLAKAKDDAAKKASLDSLAELYAERFDIDTRYQDYLVRKIERRAAKLRADVNARDAAAKEWVDAMVTLSKMKARGIETMPDLVPIENESILPTPVGIGRAATAPSSLPQPAPLAGEAHSGWRQPTPATYGEVLRTPQLSSDALEAPRVEFRPPDSQRAVNPSVDARILPPSL